MNFFNKYHCPLGLMGIPPRRLRTSKEKKMGRPLKLTKAVDSTTKVGQIGDTSQAGNQIQFTGFVTGGSANTGYASRQTGAKTFKITTSDGTADLLLTAQASGSLSAGECQLTATDSDGNTYYVSKITNNWATLVPNDGTQFSSGARARWVYSGPASGVSVSIPAA